MARKASGADQLASSRELLRIARTADELRKTQVVLLPLELRMSFEETVNRLVCCLLNETACKIVPTILQLNRSHESKQKNQSIIRLHGQYLPFSDC